MVKYLAFLLLATCQFLDSPITPERTTGTYSVTCSWAGQRNTWHRCETFKETWDYRGMRCRDCIGCYYFEIWPPKTQCVFSPETAAE